MIFFSPGYSVGFSKSYIPIPRNFRHYRTGDFIPGPGLANLITDFLNFRILILLERLKVLCQQICLHQIDRRNHFRIFRTPRFRRYK